MNFIGHSIQAVVKTSVSGTRVREMLERQGDNTHMYKSLPQISHRCEAVRVLVLPSGPLSVEL